MITDDLYFLIKIIVGYLVISTVNRVSSRLLWRGVWGRLRLHWGVGKRPPLAGSVSTLEFIKKRMETEFGRRRGVGEIEPDIGTTIWY